MNGATDAAAMISKWSAARGAIDQVAAAYGSVVELGLATFPYPDECGPGRLDVAPALGRRDAIAAALAMPPPENGAWTPLGETLLALAQEAAVTNNASDANVVVITDGFQWCSPYDPEARGLPVVGVEALRDAGVTVFVVGFGGGVDEVTLQRMAEVAGTGGYYQADDPAQLLVALMEVAAEVMCPEPPEPPEPPPAVDAGADAFVAEDEPGVPTGGCGCGAAADAGGAIGGLLVFGLGLVWILRPRGRRRRAPDRARR